MERNDGRRICVRGDGGLARHRHRLRVWGREAGERTWLVSHVSSCSVVFDAPARCPDASFTPARCPQPVHPATPRYPLRSLHAPAAGPYLLCRPTSLIISSSTFLATLIPSPSVFLCSKDVLYLRRPHAIQMLGPPRVP